MLIVNFFLNKKKLFVLLAGLYQNYFTSTSSQKDVYRMRDLINLVSHVWLGEFRATPTDSDKKYGFGGDSTLGTPRVPRAPPEPSLGAPRGDLWNSEGSRDMCHSERRHSGVNCRAFEGISRGLLDAAEAPPSIYRIAGPHPRGGMDRFSGEIRGMGGRKSGENGFHAVFRGKGRK